MTILDGVAGVQAQTETVWSQAERYHVPRVVFINKMDRDGASVSDTMDSIRTRLRVTPLLTQLPIGHFRLFSGVVDLISMEELYWDAETLGVKYKRQPLDTESNLYKMALESRSELCEQLAELDDTLMEYVINNSISPMEVSIDLIQAAIRRVTLANKAVPVLLGSSLKNIGVQPVMDAVIDYLPSPLEREAPLAYKSLLAIEEDTTSSTASSSSSTASITSTSSHHSESLKAPIKLECDPKKPLVAQAFKVVHEARSNSLVVYVRVYSGTLTSGMRLTNTTKLLEERSLRITRVRADRYEDLKELTAGDIGAVTGLKNTSTGDTLVAQKDPLNLVVKGMKIPEPVFFMSILADSVTDEDHLRQSLNVLQLEDPSFKWSINKDTGQWLLCGMGELHLEILKDRLVNYYKVKASTGDIQIAYKSSLKDEITDQWVKTYGVGGKQEEVNFKIELEPLSEGSQNEFEVAEGVVIGLSNYKKVKNELVQAVTEGVQDMFRSGVPAGFPLVGTKVTLLELNYNPSTSSHTYKLALMEAIFTCARQVGIQIMEPVMHIELVVNDEYAGGVLSDLTSKRNAVIEQVEHGGEGKKLIIGDVPLKDLMGYSTELRSLSKGTGSFVMEFSHNGSISESQQTKLLGTTYFN